MIRPSIKTYHEDLRHHRIGQISDHPHFLNRTSLDMRWQHKSPDVKIRQDGVHFELEVSMPGFRKRDIEINLDNDLLIVRAEKKTEENPSSEYVLKELDIDAIERRFKLSENMGRDKIKAKYENGILTLTFIEVTEAKQGFKRKISVR